MNKIILLVITFLFTNISAAPLGSQISLSGVALLPTGQIVAVGNVVASGVNKSIVIRYVSTGQQDPTFGSAGIVVTLVGTSTTANAVALDASDQIVVAGVATVSGVTQIYLARYTTAGTLDTTFNSTGVVTTVVTGSDYSLANALVIQADGKILVGGIAGFGSAAEFMVARYNTDGSLDTSFNAAGAQPGVITTAIGDQSSVSAVSLQSTGAIIASGTSMTESSFEFASARYTTSGILDTTYGTSGVSTVSIGSGAVSTCNAILGDDSVFLGGSYNTNNIAVVKLQSDGSLDTSFGTSGIASTTIGVSAQASCLKIQSDDKIVVCGTSLLTNQGLVTLLRYNTNGTLDTNFGTAGIATTALGFNASANDLAIQSDGKIVIAGFTDANALLMRYLSTGLRDVTFAADGLNPTPTGDPAFPSILQTISFRAMDFTKDAVALPDTNFDNTYGVTPPLISLKAWRMLPSSSAQEPITVEFDMPIDLDTTWDPTIDLKLLVANNGGTGSVINVRGRIDLKASGLQLGVTSPATGFSQTLTTGDVTVTPEPASGNLKNIRLSFSVAASTIAPRSIAVLVLDRIATTGTEYNNDVYLGSMVLRYRKLIN